MASLFSASDTRATVTAAVCVLWCLGLAPVTPVQGAFRIPQCSAQGWLEIRADQTAADVTCTGFSIWLDIKWQLKKHETITVRCYTSGQCTNPSDEIRATRANRGPTSDLYINSNHRILAGNGVVKCWNPYWSPSSASCNTNVISPAVLSNCKLMLTTEGTVAGTCNFTDAYSSNGTYGCTWILTPLDRQGDADDVITGEIHKTSYTSSNKIYYRGTCSFPLSWLPAGQYNYTVRFLPGGQYQGTETVTAPPTTPTKSTTTTTTTTPTTSSSQSTESAPSTQGDNDDEGFPLGAVVGGAVGGVVVLAIVVVVVIVIRRKRAKPAETKTGGDDVEYFEEHVNAAYVSSADEDQDPSRPNQHHQPKPSGVALRIPSTTTTTVVKDSSLAAPPQDADDGDYSTVDLDEDQAGGGYSSVDLDEDQAGGGYSSVDLDGDQAGGGYSSVDLDEDQAGGGYSSVDFDEDQAGGGYSSVDLDEDQAGGGYSSVDLVASGGDVYAQVDKGAKRHAPSQPRADARGGQLGAPLASTTPPDGDDEEDYYAHLAQGYTGRGGAPAKAPPLNASQPIRNLDDSTSDVYAHLDHGLYGVTAGGQLTGSPQAGPALTDVYARVDKSSQGNNLTPSPPQTAEAEGHVYAHPPKPRPLIKPKPALK